MKIAIIGTGSMASYYAFHLSQHYHVTMIGSWKDQIDFINKNGLEFNLQNSKNIHAILPEKAESTFEFVFILNKTYQNSQNAVLLKKIVQEDSTTVILQNGAGNSSYYPFLKKDQVLTGVTTQAALLEDLGKVKETGKGVIQFDQSHSKSKVVRELLEKLGFEVQLQKDLNQIIWTKLAINASINSITSILNIKNGEIIEHPQLKLLTHDICNTIYKGAKNNRIQLEKDLYQRVNDVAYKTAENTSSMLNDILKKKPTERSAILGYLIEKIPESNLLKKLDELIANVEQSSEFYDLDRLFFHIEETE